MAEDTVAPFEGLAAIDAHEGLPLARACERSRPFFAERAWFLPPLPRRGEYAFYNSENLASLRRYFLAGTHPACEGVVLGNLAFVKISDRSDIWLVLAREYDPETNERIWDMLDICAMEAAAESEPRFECAISALEEKDVFDIAELLSGYLSREQVAKVS